MYSLYRHTPISLVAQNEYPKNSNNITLLLYVSSALFCALVSFII